METIMSHKEVEAESKSESARKMFEEFVDGILSDANAADEWLDDEDTDRARNFVNQIIGTCECMLTILRNSKGGVV